MSKTKEFYHDQICEGMAVAQEEKEILAAGEIWNNLPPEERELRFNKRGPHFNLSFENQDDNTQADIRADMISKGYIV